MSYTDYKRQMNLKKAREERAAAKAEEVRLRGLQADAHADHVHDENCTHEHPAPTVEASVEPVQPADPDTVKLRLEEMRQQLDEYRGKLREMLRKQRNKRKALARKASQTNAERIFRNRVKHKQAKLRKKNTEALPVS